MRAQRHTEALESSWYSESRTNNIRQACWKTQNLFIYFSKDKAINSNNKLT